MSGILYQHRDNGCYYRKKAGVVERFNCDGLWVLASHIKPTDLNRWPFERAR
jgi:hypothetical protein